MLGKGCEDRDARFLSRQGDKILERNYRTLNGEIDLIVLH
ncbi:MAG: YraN family protein [Nitrospirota bacterium]|nr:YraN family protein [Nitrospirota bacterium]